MQQLSLYFEKSGVGQFEVGRSFAGLQASCFNIKAVLSVFLTARTEMNLFLVAKNGYANIAFCASR